MKIPKKRLPELLRLINCERNECEILNFVPYSESLPQGEFLAILNKESVLNIKDCCYDEYHPWTGTDDLTKNKNKFLIGTESDDFLLTLRTYRHCKNLSFRREIFFVTIDGILASHVYYKYITEIDLITPLSTRTKILPSECEKIKDACRYRRTNDAKKVLQAEGIHTTTKRIASLSRSINSHVKGKAGRTAPTNYHKIIDRHLARPFREETLEHPEVIIEDSGKLALRVIFGYPDAFNCFVAALPTKEDIDNHRDAVELLETMRGNEAREFFNSFLGSLNESGAVPTIGSAISIDTTFSLASSEYLTVLLAISDDFQNKVSSKSSSLVLACMLHTRKASEDHRAFANFINKMFLKSDCKRQKVLGTLITDGEDSFKCYTEGEYLSQAYSMRCDRHRLDNMKMTCATEGEFEFVQNALYGEKKETATGHLLKQSVLQVLNRDEYNERLFRLMNSNCVCDSTKKWLLQNADSLYLKNSLIKKLYCGWPVQYFTTNIIEAKNNWIKNLVTSKEPGEKLMDDLLTMHRSEIQDRVNALTGKDSTLKCLMFKSQHEWNLMSILDRRNFLQIVGLGSFILQTDFDGFPAYVLEGITCMQSFLTNLKSLDVFETEEKKCFFLYNKEKKESTKVGMKSYDLICTNKLCPKPGPRDPICVHRMKVMLHVSDETRNLIFKRLECNRKGITYIDLMRSQSNPADCTKNPTKRKGHSFSSGNVSRRIEGLVLNFEGKVTISDV